MTAFEKKKKQPNGNGHANGNGKLKGLRRKLADAQAANAEKDRLIETIAEQVKESRRSR
jgi:hypothetical protein